MRQARRLTLSAMGVVDAIAAFEHGLGDFLQGPIAPAGIVIQSWPDSEFYRSLSGEPALTLIPDLAVSGAVTMALAVVLLIWMIGFVDRRFSAAVIALLSVALFPVGGGFGPPVLGLMLAAAATKVRSPLRWWQSRCPGAVKGLLAAVWPVVAFVCVAVWLVMLFGIAALDYFVGFENEGLTWGVLAAALIALPLAVISSLAHDAVALASAHSQQARQPGAHTR